MILDQFRVDGKVAVVTGGTKGLGRAITIGLAQAGADIAVISRNGSEELEKTITALGRRYIHHSADLCDRAQTKAVIPAIVDKLEHIDILVNNAGIIRRDAAQDYCENDWDLTLEIDLTAAFILSQAAGRIMLKNRKGKIINVVSIMAFQGGLNVVGYAASKHALAGVTKAFSNEWASKGVNVNALAPSFFVTELTQAVQENPERSKSIINRTPIGRWGKPEEIAGAALFLASAASDFINGVILPVDGGWMGW